VLAHVATILILLGTLTLLYIGFVRTRPSEPVVIVPAVEVPVATPAATPGPDKATPFVLTAPPVAFQWTFADAEHNHLALSPQLTVAPDGNLWVVDGVRMGFQILSPDGELLEHWGTPGTGDGQFAFKVDAENAQSRVAFRPDGGFYVVDTQNRRIQQFAPDRSFVRSWGEFGTGDGQFVKPLELLVAADGTVSVIDTARNDVQQFDRDGQFLRTFGQRGSGEGELNGPGWGAIDAAGNLWIADIRNNRIVQFGPDGTFLRAIGDKGTGNGQFDVPQAIAIDTEGRLYVTDSANARVQVFDADGAFLFAFNGADVGGKALTWPIGIAIDSQGGIYVEEYATTDFIEKVRLVPDAAISAPSRAPP
jgi:sugar lactone lactonase YvrE